MSLECPSLADGDESSNSVMSETLWTIEDDQGLDDRSTLPQLAMYHGKIMSSPEMSVSRSSCAQNDYQQIYPDLLMAAAQTDPRASLPEA